MENTTKHETVLVLQKTHGALGEGPLWFGTPEGEEVPGATVVLPHREWVDLGSPETVTIAVWPGDKLNSQPFTRATREELDEETQEFYRQSMGHPLGDNDGGDPGGENIAKP